jgi:hypothetical protein
MQEQTDRVVATSNQRMKDLLYAMNTPTSFQMVDKIVNLETLAASPHGMVAMNKLHPKEE